jgi:hypothetical protein
MLCEIGEMEGIIQNGKAAGVHPQRPCFVPCVRRLTASRFFA